MSCDRPWSPQELAAIETLHQKLFEIRRALDLEPVSRRFVAPERETEFLHIWKDLLPKVQAVSLNLWDTALLRQCARAEDRFLFLKALPPFDALKLSREELYSLRLRAEELTCEAHRQQTGAVHTSLETIYERLAREADLPALDIAACVEAELQLEEFLVHPNRPILQLAQSALTAGKTLIIVTDAWLDQKTVADLLTRAGYPAIPPEQLFTPVNSLTAFAGGNLLRKAARSLDLPSGEILHIGCDPESDAIAARLAGTLSLTHPYGTLDTLPTQHRALTVRHTESLLRGTTRTLDFPPSLPPDDQSFWLQQGAQALGPMLSCFTLWLAGQWRKHHIQHAYFLGRSGQVLYQLYQSLRQHHSDLPPAEMLHASRRALLLPSLGCQASANLPSLFSGYGLTPIGELVAQLDIDPTRFPEAFSRAGFHSLNTPIDPDSNPVRIQRLFRDPDLLSALDERAREERAHLLRYLQQQRLITDCPAALVDLGWNNTLTRSLLTILHHEEIHHTLTGFHLLTLSEAQDPLLPDYHYHSYLTHHGEPLFLSERMAEGRALLHTLCAADHPPLRYFARIGSQVQPVFTPLPPNPEQTAQLHNLHQGILSYSQALFESPLHCTLMETPPEIAAAEFIRLVHSPTPLEAQKFGALHYLNGSPHPRQLAFLPEGQLTPSEWLFVHQHADWKAGLLGLNSQPAWILRQLLS